MKKKSEKLLLDADDQGAETEREKEDLQFGDQTHEQILLRDNISASAGASVVAPEQEDFNNTRGAMNMKDRRKGEIELISQEQKHIITPAMSENYAKQAPGNSVVGDISMSDLEGELLDPGPKDKNPDESKDVAAVASPDDIALLDPEKGEKSAREDQKT